MKVHIVSIPMFIMLAWYSTVCGLTIYRIGGGDLPRPEIAEEYEFVQLRWADITEKKHGYSELLEFDDGVIRPQSFDPEVNLVPIIEEKGGQIFNLVWIGWGPPQQDDFFMFDEDPNTSYLGDGHFATHGPTRKSLTFDFGARLLLERIRFYPREQYMADRFIQYFKIGINDGDPLKDGTREFKIGQRGSDLDFDIVYDVVENTSAMIDLPLPNVPIRRLLFSAPENTRGIWEIAEMEIYGNGFAPFANYVSNVIDLGTPASLGQLSWSGRVNEGADVGLSMRSGLDEDPNIYWRNTFRGGERTRFDAAGRPLSLSTYNRLQRGEQAGMTHDTEKWAFWGAAYDFSRGQGQMVGDGPQRYVQIRADFTSGITASSELDYIQFAVSIPPVASLAIAEIHPSQVTPGQITTFTYSLLPQMQKDDLGFDSIVIDTPSKAQSIDEVRISSIPVDFDVVSHEDEGFIVRIPRIDVQRTEELIEVDFQAEVFQFGTVFSGRLFESEHPTEVPQSITAGNANDLVESDRLSVALTRFEDNTIQSLSIQSPVCTPNGDGVNDLVQINYELLNLVGPVPIQVEIYDLSGRSLGVVWSDAKGSGRHSVQWNGHDQNGNLITPGIYVLQMSVEADTGVDTKKILISFAY